MRKFFPQDGAFQFPLESSDGNEDAFSLAAINTIAVIAAVVLLIYILLSLTVASFDQSFSGPIGILTIALIARTLRLRDWVVVSKSILLGGLWLFLTYKAVEDGGLQSLSFTTMLLSIFAAGLVVGVRGVALYAVAVMLTGSGLFYLQVTDRIETQVIDDDSLRQWLVYMITIISAAVFTIYSAKRVGAVLAMLRQKEQLLLEKNHEQEIERQAQKQTVLQLEHSKSLLEATFEAIADGILVVDNKRDFVAMNQTFSAIWDLPAGAEHSQDRLRHAQQLLKFPDKFLGKVNEIYADPTNESYDLVELADGRSYERLSMPQRLGEEVIGRVWTYRDITALKKVEQALRVSEERFRNIFELAPIAIAMTKLEGTFIQVNRAMCQMLGYSSDQLQQMSSLQITHPDDIAVQEPMREKLRLGKISKYQIEKRYLRADKSVVIASLHVSLVKDENGHPLYDIGIIVDLTEQKRTEEALRQAQKLESLGVMSGGIAHDFNNMLTAILGQSSLALSRLSDGSKARSSIEKIVSATHRATDLTRQLLAYSGRGHFESKPIALNNIIRDNLHLAEVAMESKAELNLDIAESLPNIKGDTGQIQQIVMNLIMNAAEAIQEDGGLISICTRFAEIEPDSEEPLSYADEPIAPGRYVILEIGDNGSGMDQETLSKIFDPFFTTKMTGRGLGLAAVLGIVRGHNGALQVQSQPNEGTIFRLYFPMSTEQTDAPPRAKIGNWDQEARGAVLIIDDHAAIREAASGILNAEGIDALAAVDGVSGIQLFRERQADIQLILLDLSMPGLSGEETLLRLREIDAQIPIILTSGYSEIESKIRVNDGNVNAFLQKPYSWDQLIDMVRQHVRPVSPSGAATDSGSTGAS